MITVEQIAQELRRRLPEETNSDINTLAQILADAARNNITSSEAKQAIEQNYGLTNIIRELSNTFIQPPGGVITFGANSNIGDITINDVAGGNIIKIERVTLSTAAKPDPVFNFASCSTAFMITFGLSIIIGWAGILIIGIIVNEIMQINTLNNQLIICTAIPYIVVFGFVWWVIYRVIRGKVS